MAPYIHPKNISGTRFLLSNKIGVFNPLQHSGHYMYRTVVTICTAQWSLYVPPVVTIRTASGHYMYRIVVTICTASGHYTYRTVVTICTAQWSIYVPHSGHYMYRQLSLYVPPVVTICTA